MFLGKLYSDKGGERMSIVLTDNAIVRATFDIDSNGWIVETNIGNDCWERAGCYVSQSEALMNMYEYATDLVS